MAADVTREDGFKNRGTIAEARTREAPTQAPTRGYHPIRIEIEQDVHREAAV